MALKLVGGRDVAKFKASKRAFNKRVGIRLREARVAAGLSLAQAAIEIGDVSEASVSRYENGLGAIRAITAYHLCQLYGIEYGSLFK